jgi:hypothetical protein
VKKPVSKFAFRKCNLQRYTEVITLTTDYTCKGNEKLIAVSYASLAKDVSPGGAQCSVSRLLNPKPLNPKLTLFHALFIPYKLHPVVTQA